MMSTILNDYRPKTLIITTPNKEYNAVYEMNESFRHNDHRFEWTRDEFKTWCENQNNLQSYELVFVGIGETHELYGQPTQLCVFKRREL